MRIIGVAAIATLLAGNVCLHSQGRAEVKSASPASLNLEKGSTSSVTLQGTGLQNLAGAQLMSDDSTPVQGVTASLAVQPLSSSVMVNLRASWDAKEGDKYYLRFITATGSFSLSATIFRASVAWPQPKISSFPRVAPVGSITSIRGRGRTGPGRILYLASCCFCVWERG